MNGGRRTLRWAAAVVVAVPVGVASDARTAGPAEVVPPDPDEGGRYVTKSLGRSDTETASREVMPRLLLAP